MFDVINSKKCPETSIGKQCKAPYDCPICGCWEHLPENHVFCLYRGGKLSYELYDKGVELIKDIPEEIKLNDKQGIQRFSGYKFYYAGFFLLKNKFSFSSLLKLSNS